MNYVIIGASAAGVNAVRELRRLRPQDRITLISKDREIYSRCILHHYLDGARSREQLCFAEEDFESRYQVNWKKGVSCAGIKPAEKLVVLSDGSKEPYDKLLIASGSHTFFPLIPGLSHAGNVYGLRNLEDAEILKEKAGAASHVVIMGGGLIGMDAAVGMIELGKSIALVEMENRLLPKQLDAEGSLPYEKALKDRGATLYLETGVEEVICGPDHSVQQLLLTSGQTIPCDLLVVTTGIRPNISFLEGSGIETDRFGLVIDETGRTNIEDIYGAGDVTGRSPIWPAAVKQGIVAADNMCGIPQKMTDFFASKSTMNFLGIASMSLGIPEAPDDTYLVETERQDGIYRKLIHKNGKIYGAILQGDLSYGGILTQLIAHRIDVSRVKKPLFKIDYSDFFRIKDNFEFYYEEPMAE